MDPLTRTILTQLHANFGVSIPLSEGGAQVTLIAKALHGEHWLATAENEYRAACALAELLGFELMDGQGAGGER